MKYTFVFAILLITSCNFSEQTESVKIGSKKT